MPFLSLYLLTDVVQVLKMIIKNRGIFNHKKEIPKLLIYLFISFNFFFGFDFGFTEWIQDRKFRFTVKIVKTLSALACASILAACLIDFTMMYSLWHLFNFLQYLMCFFVLSATKYNLYSFSKDLYGLCSNCVDSRKDRVVTVVVLYLFLGTSMKIFAFLAECVYFDDQYVLDCQMGRISLYLYMLPCISLDIIPLVLVISYYYMNTFIASLKEAYFESEISLDYLEKNYIAIMDCFDKIKPFYGNLVSKRRDYVIKFVWWL